MMRNLTLLILSLLLGCAPSLGNKPPSSDDDDDTTIGDDDDFGDDDFGDDDSWSGDDDDSWIGDDDDDDFGDDDSWIGDDDDQCANPGEPWYWLESSLGFDGEGTWYEGDLRTDNELISLTTAEGEVLEVYFDATWMTWGLNGPGRLFWYSPGNSGWGNDSVFAALTDDGWAGLIVGVNTLPPETLTDGTDYTLRIQPRPGWCSDWTWEDDCGVVSTMPLQVELGMNGSATSADVYPGGSFWMDDWVFEYPNGLRRWETWCPDVGDEYSWHLMLNMPVPG